MEWFYAKGGQQAGPVDQATLTQMLATGQVAPNDLVWNEALPNWQPAGSIPALASAPRPMTPPPGVQSPYGVQQPYAPPQQFPQQPGFNPQNPQLAYGGYADPAKSYKGMAIGAFVCSLVGLLCAGIILGTVSIILGAVAMNGMKTTGNRDGRGLALAAVIIGIIDIVAFIAWLAFVFAMRQ